MANKNGETAIHLSLQGKGGVGKSLVASVLAQYFRARGADVKAVDTDPVNHTLAQYQQLDVQCLELLRDGGIDQRGFDVLLERLLTESGTFVVEQWCRDFHTSLVLHARKPCPGLAAESRPAPRGSLGRHRRTGPCRYRERF